MTLTEIQDRLYYPEKQKKMYEKMVFRLHSTTAKHAMLLKIHFPII